MSDSLQPAGTLDTREDAGRGPRGVVKFWLEQIDIASQQEKDWREEGEKTVDTYKSDPKSEHRKKFNILYSNTETLAAAIYNSTPIPDVRRRFAEQDDQARVAAQALERCVSYALDQYDPDSVMRAVVKDGLLPGRGMSRIRFKPGTSESPHEQVWCEDVDWRSVRHGPALAWGDIPWLAFEHYLTREQFEAVNERVGKEIGLNHELAGARTDSERRGAAGVTDVFRRGQVWEIWDKAKREVVWIAPEWDDAPVLVDPDPLGLAGFFPVPRPFCPIELTADLCPVPPYRLYKALADELDELTLRITTLTKAIKWRGAYTDPGVGSFLTKFESLEDGELAPMDNPSLKDAGIDRAFWFQPIKEASETLIRLYEAREQVKQAIYEVTGIADLLRGSSQASETATAQNIKAQWGALRVATMQTEIQRYARDLIRLKVEVIAEKFRYETIAAMSGMQIGPEVFALMRKDALRNYRIDVETDSTIRADLQRQQQNIAQFVQGFGSFIQSVGPAVQAGAMPMNVVGEMVKSFSRVFKLGRAVEEALDKLPTEIQQPDPNAAAQQQAQMDAQMRQAELDANAAMKREELGQRAQSDMARLDLDARKHAETLQFEREKHAMEIATRASESDRADRSERVAREDSDRNYQLAARKADFDEAVSGVRRRSDGRAVTVEESRDEDDQASRRELANAAKEQAQAATRLAEAVEAASKVVRAPKRIVRGPGREMRIEPVTVN